MFVKSLFTVFSSHNVLYFYVIIPFDNYYALIKIEKSWKDNS